MLWNKKEITEKQALVFFHGRVRGRDKKKNLVKIFEPKSLYQSLQLNSTQLNSICLQANTLSYRHSLQRGTKHHVLPINPYNQPKINSPQTFHTNLFSFTNNQNTPLNPLVTPLTQTLQTKTNTKPTKTIRNKELDRCKAKGLCFWCDEKYFPKNRCKTKRIYFMFIIDNEDDL